MNTSTSGGPLTPAPTALAPLDLLPPSGDQADAGASGEGGPGPANDEQDAVAPAEPLAPAPAIWMQASKKALSGTEPIANSNASTSFIWTRKRSSLELAPVVDTNPLTVIVDPI